MAATPSPQGAQPQADTEDSSTATCPICAFIEAGPCKTEHQVWVKCREEAKAAGKDYVDECEGTFKSFLQCTLQHDYYEPFLEMLSLNQEQQEEEEEGDKGKEHEQKA